MMDYYKMIVEAWRLMKKHLNASTDQEFEALHNDCIELDQKYRCDFMQDIILAICKEIERRFHERG